MTLARALAVATALHLALLAMPLPGVGGDAVAPVDPDRSMSLLLVTAIQTLGETDAAEGAATTDATARAANGGGARTDARPGEAHAAAAAESAAAPAPASVGMADAPDAPTLQDIAVELGLDLDGVSEPLLDRIFPVMLKVHLQGGRPSASNYRQLLRTYLDVVMGYPWAVQRQLGANSQLRFLGRFEVEVAGDGSLRLMSLLMNEDLDDADARLAAYYERSLADAVSRPFLPPSRAGLPAPVLLSFQLLNPEARIW